METGRHHGFAADTEVPLAHVPDGYAEGHECEQDGDDEGENGAGGPDVEGEDGGAGDFGFPEGEEGEVEDGGDEDYVDVGCVPAGLGCLARMGC